MEIAPLRLGALVTLSTFALAGLLGLIAVLDADRPGASLGTGLGVSLLVFLAGATVACALACLKRGRAELVSLGAIAAAGLATDLIVLAVWQEIDSEAYGKVAGVALVWSFLGLVILGLALAVGEPNDLARLLYVGAVAATLLAGAVSTWLIATGGEGGGIPVGDDFGLFPASGIGDDGLLRALGACFVLLASLWFSALAASRLERPLPPAS